MNIEIIPLSKDRLGDFFSFFESVHFVENPDWSVCYCYSFHFTGPARQWNRENNMAAVEKLVGENRMKGYLAYHEGNPIGWCNTNNRLNYQRLVKLYDLVDPRHPKTCAIVCFLIHQDYRRRGIAQQILQHIIKDYSDQDFEIIEAYPRKGELSTEKHYMGPLELYLRNGFELVRDFKHYTLVRKSLKNA